MTGSTNIYNHTPHQSIIINPCHIYIYISISYSLVLVFNQQMWKIHCNIPENLSAPGLSGATLGVVGPPRCHFTATAATGGADGRAPNYPSLPILHSLWWKLASKKSKTNTVQDGLTIVNMIELSTIVKLWFIKLSTNTVDITWYNYS